MFNIGPGELLAIGMVALIVLGPQRLPHALRQVGRVIGELRRISGGFQDEIRRAIDDMDSEPDTPLGEGVVPERDARRLRELQKPERDEPEHMQLPTDLPPIEPFKPRTMGPSQIDLTGDVPEVPDLAEDRTDAAPEPRAERREIDTPDTNGSGDGDTSAPAERDTGS